MRLPVLPEDMLWVGQEDTQSDDGTSTPIISDIQNILPSQQHERVEDVDHVHLRFVSKRHAYWYVPFVLNGMSNAQVSRH